MKTLVEQITSNFEAFAKDAQAQVENGNKAAGARARKVPQGLYRCRKIIGAYVSPRNQTGDSPLTRNKRGRGSRRIFFISGSGRAGHGRVRGSCGRWASCRPRHGHREQSRGS